jgi:hypothetical protein
MALSDILNRRPATSVNDVVDILSAVDAVLPDADGLKWFNRLYLRVTTAVREAIRNGVTLRDPAFVERLDVVFGNLYFDAAAAGSVDAPRAWRPVLLARNDRGIARLQFALAGMNAHINRDLPVGIVDAFLQLGGSPTSDVARHADFDGLNDILEAVEDRVKTEFLTGILGEIDVLADRVDDIVVMWSIRSAREAAWTHAEVLWSLRDSPALRAAFLSSLDGFTGFAGRGLLAHVA